jgi:nitrogen fixation/metabolism regulation signal transduction histidine kinase
MYIGTLTLALFLSMFAAVLLAALLGNQLVRPLLLLAEGVRDVAKGDLSPRLAMSSKDELGGLTRAFADMTQQLADARNSLGYSMAQQVRRLGLGVAIGRGRAPGLVNPAVGAQRQGSGHIDARNRQSGRR